MEEQTQLLHCESNVIASIAQLYQQTEESLADEVQILKKWMESQPHLPEILDDKRLQNFLILNKCNTEKAKRRIDMYYTIRSQMSDIYDSALVNPVCSNFKEILNFLYYMPLPKMTKDMHRVFVWKLQNKEMVHKIQPYDILRMGSNLQEIRLKEDVMVGDLAICDLEGVNIRFLAKITPVFLAKALKLYQEVYSIPLKGVYIINPHPLINPLLTAAKCILKPKIFKRLHVCKNKNILTEKFPLEILPEDYGGKEKSLEELLGLWRLKFEQHKDRFSMLDKLRVNEDLRPLKVQNSERLGHNGNLKILNID